MNAQEGITARVRAAVIATGLNDEDLGVRCGVATRTVAGWRSGRNLPDAVRLVALAQACGVSIDTLLTGTAPVEGTFADGYRFALQLMRVELGKLAEADPMAAPADVPTPDALARAHAAAALAAEAEAASPPTGARRRRPA